MREKSESESSYLGTPNDARMYDAIKDLFDPIHIGTGEETSHKKVTELEFIRWRATVFGTRGQRKLIQDRELAKFSKTKAVRDTLPSLSHLPVIDPIQHKKLGKPCSNGNCLHSSRYDAATNKITTDKWFKRTKECVLCNGRVHYCFPLIF